MSGSLEPALYFGTLRHRRFRPVAHQFHYSVFLAFLDVDRIPETMARSRLSSYNGWNWAAFLESDHFGDPAMGLRARVERHAKENGVSLPAGGPIYLLTHLRYLGYHFNPISLFYCCAPSGHVEAVLAEVNSTFGERRLYWLFGANRTTAESNPKALRFRCGKEMHVSPFHDMALVYDFALTQPAGTLVAHMATLDGRESQEGALFDATLTLRRKEWTAANLRGALAQHPWMTAKVIAGIHWQALRLYWKGAPVYTYPAKRIDHD